MKGVAIAPGLTRTGLREQPWCYVYGIWRHLFPVSTRYGSRGADSQAEEDSSEPEPPGTGNGLASRQRFSIGVRDEPRSQRYRGAQARWPGLMLHDCLPSFCVRNNEQGRVERTGCELAGALRPSRPCLSLAISGSDRSKLMCEADLQRVHVHLET